jgi:hypothetical protein
MSTLNYNPYNLTDAEIFGSTNQAIALQSMANRWLAIAGLTNLGTIKSTDKAAIAGVLAKIGQLPRIIAGDAASVVAAMTAIQLSLKAKYSVPQITGYQKIGGGLFGISKTIPIYSAPGGITAERKAIVTNLESDGNVIFKFGGEKYLYWAGQYRLIALATESVRSKLIPLGITLPV